MNSQNAIESSDDNRDIPVQPKRKSISDSLNHMTELRQVEIELLRKIGIIEE